MTTLRKQDALQGVWDGLRLFPFSLAVGVCSPFGLAGGFVTAAVCGVFGLLFGAAFYPTYLMLLPVFALAFHYGSGVAAVAVALGGVFTFLLHRLPASVRSRLREPAVYAGLIPAAAFVTTALQTTNYFGIGAVGGTAWEIIADYISLGFHPNWRGILYGTIALVVLITYPRKFKRLHTMLSPAFVTLAIVLPLNLLLIPDAVHTPINEIGRLSLPSPKDFFGLYAFPRGVFWPALIPAVLCAALALALLATVAENQKRPGPHCAVNLCAGLLGGLPCETDREPRGRIGAAVCAVLAVVLYFVPGLARLPLHAAAVILIVTAWQSLPKQAIRDAFRTRRGTALFFCALLLPILIGVHYAVPLLASIGVLTNEKQKPQS